MANCPTCGSNHIQIKKETNVSWGRAATGYMLFGVAGAAVGAITGDDRNVNACLDCGTSWKATTLYNMLQIVKTLTGKTIDLSIETERDFLSSFTNAIEPELTELNKLEKQLKDRNLDAETRPLLGCYWGCIIAVFALPLIMKSGLGLSLFLAIWVGGILLGNQVRKTELRELKGTKITNERYSEEIMEKIRKKALLLIYHHGIESE